MKTSKINEKILKATGNKQLVTYMRTPIILSANFSADFAGQKGVAQYIQSIEREKSTKRNKVIYTARLSFRIVVQIKSFPDKRIHHH